MTPTPAELIALVERGEVRRLNIYPQSRNSTLEVVYSVDVPAALEEAYDQLFQPASDGITLDGRRFVSLDSDGASSRQPDHAWSLMQVTYADAAAAQRLPIRAGTATVSTSLESTIVS